jgi:Transposase DDE domain group 1
VSGTKPAGLRISCCRNIIVRDQQEAPLTMTETMPFLPGLSPVGGKTITATFDGGTLSSNGGVLILREIEKRLGLARVLSRHIPDGRDGGVSGTATAT